MKNYEILSKLDETMFSEIFIVRLPKTNKEVVLKKALKGQGDLRKERMILKELQNVDGVPKLFELKETNDDLLIIEKLGDSLEVLKLIHGVFDLKRVIQIGVQLIAILKGIHEKGFIHRDIKPDNILFRDDSQKQVCLIDYGFAKRFRDSQGHIFLNTKKRSFKGTMMFASRNAHSGCTTSRRDDLESLWYTLVYLFKGFLPWSQYLNPNTDMKIVENLKIEAFEKGIFENLPMGFKLFFTYIGKLSFSQTPDYDVLTNILCDMYNKNDLDLTKSNSGCSEVSISLKNQNVGCEEIGKEEDWDDWSPLFTNMQKNLLFIKQSPIKIADVMSKKS